MQGETFEIEGRVWHKQGTGYYVSKGDRLHRWVWSQFWGDVPEGYHIHHVDGDKDNNALANLELIEAKAHNRMHMMEQRLWEVSPTEPLQRGREEFFKNPPKTVKSCEMCGKTYETVWPTRARWCSKSCGNKASLNRKKARG